MARAYNHPRIFPTAILMVGILVELKASPMMTKEGTQACWDI